MPSARVVGIMSVLLHRFSFANPADNQPRASKLLLPPTTTSKISTSQSTAGSVGPGPARFTLVALATYPRSGTTWTINLLRAAGGISTCRETKTLFGSDNRSDVGRAWPPSMHQPWSASVLGRLVQLHRATPEEATDDQILAYLLAHNIVKPLAKGPPGSTSSQAAGVKEVATGTSPEHCSEEHAVKPSEVSLRSLPPIVIKTHAPTITHHDDVEVVKLLLDADIRVHTVRNPLDNIVSRFHGNRRAFNRRKTKENWWPDLVAARERNETTKEFAEYAPATATKYTAHHHYWIRFAAQHGLRHPSVFVRYESLCTDLNRTLPKLLQKMRFPIHQQRIECALRKYPCTAPQTYPEHGRYYTLKQRAQVLIATRSISSIAGYDILRNGSLVFTKSELDMLH